MSVDYQEWPAPAGLQRQVQCLWRLRDPDPPAHPQVIYPDGRCELIIHLGAPMQRRGSDGSWSDQSHCLFAAQQRDAIVLRACEPLDCVGIRLRTAASSCVAGACLAELRDQIVDLAALDAEVSIELHRAAVTWAQTDDLGQIWAALQRLLGSFQPDALVESALADLDAEGGMLRIAELARRANMPLRSFQQRFLRQTGMAAKEYARLMRLQTAIRLLDQGGRALSETALASGFSDQAHATRELRRLTGLTPARLVAALRDHRDAAETIELAAAFVRGTALRSGLAPEPR